jgi:hypothetical protein
LVLAAGPAGGVVIAAAGTAGRIVVNRERERCTVTPGESLRTVALEYHGSTGPKTRVHGVSHAGNTFMAWFHDIGADTPEEGFLNLDPLTDVL